MSSNDFTTRVVQFIDDPKQSDALTEIKRLSNQAKNKSSRNLIHINNARDIFDTNTEMNTEINKNMFKENNGKSSFQRRKRQFATQINEPNIANEVKRKAILKKWKGLFDNDENEENEIKKKNKKKRVDFALNYKNKKEDTNTNNQQKKNDADKTLEIDNKRIKTKDDTEMNITKKRKTSTDDREMLSSRIIRYFEEPTQTNALAEIKRLSEQAKKNKTSKNLIYIKPDEIINPPKEENKHSKSFTRRKFQFATTVYNPKKTNLTLMEELNKYKNVKMKNKEKESFNSGSEDDESEDSIFNLEKLEKEPKEENKENTNTNDKIDNKNKNKEEELIKDKEEIIKDKEEIIKDKEEIIKKIKKK